MKKFIYLVPFLLVTTLLQAQFTVEDYDGVPILDGDIRSFNSVVEAEATLYFWINNDTTEDILVKIKNESITNADGSAYQFCFGTLCIFDITKGQTYPVSGIPETIPAGGTNPQFDKFFNQNEGDGSNFPLDYVWKFFQVDENGDEIGESITFTYRYDPTLNTSDFQLNQMGVTLNNTVGSNEIQLTVKTPVSYETFNLQGKLIQKNGLSVGNSTIDVSGYKSGLYVMVFHDEAGNKATAKFIKK